MDESGIAATVERARRGDPEAVAGLFRAYESDVARLCTRLLGSAEEAKDAASEVYLRLQSGIESYDRAQPFRRWLLSVAAHHAVDRLRRRATEQRLFSDADLEAGDLASPGPTPLQRALREEGRVALLAALDELPDKFRAPLVLRYYAELDYDAIAETLGVTRAQVGTLLFRAKRRLRTQLGERGLR